MRFPSFIEVAGAALLLASLLSCGQSQPPPETAAKPARPAAAAKPEITQFYAAGGVVERGKEVTVCYGVANADEVTIEPRVRDLKPARNRCFSLAPKKSQVYTLTASGPGGSATAQLTLQVVQPESPPPRSGLITTFLPSRDTVPKGSSVTLCYAVDGAEKVEIDPPVRELAPTGRCFTVQMEKTTDFTLKVTGGGRTEQRTITVTVQ